MFYLTTHSSRRRRRRRPAIEHWLPAASGQTTLLSARLAANQAGLAGSAGLVRVCTHAFSFPSSAWPASHRLRRQHRPLPAIATFRPKATFRKLGGYVATRPNLSILNRCDLDRCVTTCQKPRRLLHVYTGERLAGLAGLAGSACSAGLVRVCTHAESTFDIPVV